MEDKEAAAWGHIYGVLDNALREKTGNGLTQTEYQQATIKPQYMFGAIMRRALASQAISNRAHAIIAMFVRDIEYRKVDGSTELTPSQQGIMQAAYITTEPDKYLVTAAQAARMLGVSRARVSQLCSTGKLDSIGDTANVYITRESVESRIK